MREEGKREDISKGKEKKRREESLCAFMMGGVKGFEFFHVFFGFLFGRGGGEDGRGGG